jgi:transcriptional/translational regulatory protein YebC/TACO1
LEKVKEALGDAVDTAELDMTPTQTVAISDEKKATSVMKLINQLDDLDDVLSVSANFDIPDGIMNSL